jgi:hypothetical protein
MFICSFFHSREEMVKENDKRAQLRLPVVDAGCGSSTLPDGAANPAVAANPSGMQAPSLAQKTVPTRQNKPDAAAADDNIHLAVATKRAGGNATCSATGAAASAAKGPAIAAAAGAAVGAAAGAPTGAAAAVAVAGTSSGATAGSIPPKPAPVQRRSQVGLFCVLFFFRYLFAFIITIRKLRCLTVVFPLYFSSLGGIVLRLLGWSNLTSC